MSPEALWIPIVVAIVPVIAGSGWIIYLLKRLAVDIHDVKGTVRTIETREYDCATNRLPALEGRLARMEGRLNGKEKE